MSFIKKGDVCKDHDVFTRPGCSSAEALVKPRACPSPVCPGVVWIKSNNKAVGVAVSRRSFSSRLSEEQTRARVQLGFVCLTLAGTFLCSAAYDEAAWRRDGDLSHSRFRGTRLLFFFFLYFRRKFLKLFVYAWILPSSCRGNCCCAISASSTP